MEGIYSIYGKEADQVLAIAYSFNDSHLDDEAASLDYI